MMKIFYIRILLFICRRPHVVQSRPLLVIVAMELLVIITAVIINAVIITAVVINDAIIFIIGVIVETRLSCPQLLSTFFILL